MLLKWVTFLHQRCILKWECVSWKSICLPQLSKKCIPNYLKIFSRATFKLSYHQEKKEKLLLPPSDPTRKCRRGSSWGDICLRSSPLERRKHDKNRNGWANGRAIWIPWHILPIFFPYLAPIYVRQKMVRRGIFIFNFLGLARKNYSIASGSTMPTIFYARMEKSSPPT